MTRQRAVILEEIKNVANHPTAEDLYTTVRRRLPHVSLGTIYRNLDLLCTCGEIKKLEGVGNSRRFDGDLSPHAHICCSVCGKVADILFAAYPPELAEPKIEGFQQIKLKIEYEGLCDACSDKLNKLV